MFALGAGLILVGSNFLVTSGQALAAALGVPSIIIGLSVVAVGTSLPELVTGVSAARKGVPDLSLGNIIGANILNLYLIVGLSGAIHPLTLDAFTQFYSFGWLAVFFTAVVALAARTGRFHRTGGLVLLALYVVYLAGLVVLPMAGAGL
jgi:cation:H+ antiporter